MVIMLINAHSIPFCMYWISAVAASTNSLLALRRYHISVVLSSYGTYTQTCGEKACHPERSEGSLRPGNEILRCAQDDRPESTHVRSREVFSPNVYKKGCTYACKICHNPVMIRKKQKYKITLLAQRKAMLPVSRTVLEATCSD